MTLHAERHQPLDAPTAIAEETLDPADWEELRALGHRMVDDMLAYLRTVRGRPVWQPVPEDVKRSRTEPVPREPSEVGAVYEQFRRGGSPS